MGDASAARTEKFITICPLSSFFYLKLLHKLNARSYVSMYIVVKSLYNMINFKNTQLLCGEIVDVAVIVLRSGFGKDSLVRLLKRRFA